MASSRAGIASTSTVAGCSPSSPSRTALSLPWPRPVRPSEPYRATRTVCTRGSRASSRRPTANIRAAFIGPTVCELDGPMPTLNRSKTLIVMMCSAGDRGSVEDYGPVVVEQHPVLRVPGHGAGEHLGLDVTARLREPLGRQRMVHPDHVLLDDRPLVQVRGDVVRGRAD